MKKKLMIFAVVGLMVMALAAPAAFGAVESQDSQNPQLQQFFNQMYDWHQQWLDQAQKDGQITPEQAQAWKEHFNYMRDYLNKYGFGLMGSMMGGSYSGMMGGFNGNYGGMTGNNNSSFDGMMDSNNSSYDGMMGNNNSNNGGMMGGGFSK